MPLARTIGLAACWLLYLSQPAAGQNAAPVAESSGFDAVAAWSEFESVLRSRYAYFERRDIDVEAQLARSRALAMAEPDPAKFRRAMHQTALTFMDPHLIVGPLTDDDYAVVMTAADLDVKFVNGRLTVMDVRAGSPAFKAGIRPGNVVRSIDGEAPDRAARLPFGPVLPNPTAAQLDYGALLAVNGRRGAARHLTIAGNSGGQRTITLPSTREYARSLAGRPPVSIARAGERGRIGVIRIANSLGNNDTIKAFDNALRTLAGSEAIVLDLRDTPSGGNTEVGRSIIGHFTRTVRPYQMHRVPALEREFTVPRQFVEYVFPRDPIFTGPVYVLHGRWTGSMGEGIVIGMDAATDAITIGSNMGDLLGALWNIDLKKSASRVDLGGEALFHVDGTPREDFVADIPIASADSASDGSDPAMTAAVAAFASRR